MLTTIFFQYYTFHFQKDSKVIFHRYNHFLNVICAIHLVYALMHYFVEREVRVLEEFNSSSCCWCCSISLLGNTCWPSATSSAPGWRRLYGGYCYDAFVLYSEISAGWWSSCFPAWSRGGLPASAQQVLPIGEGNCGLHHRQPLRQVSWTTRNTIYRLKITSLDGITI